MVSVIKCSSVCLCLIPFLFLFFCNLLDLLGLCSSGIPTCPQQNTSFNASLSTLTKRSIGVCSHLADNHQINLYIFLIALKMKHLVRKSWLQLSYCNLGLSYLSVVKTMLNSKLFLNFFCSFFCFTCNVKYFFYFK